ncbi:MAG: NACHT domain-containing protein [Chloroflexaceae bacterium]|nr:NACHT domain-containing protein [Chloroflexaceae bacterium]
MNHAFVTQTMLYHALFNQWLGTGLQTSLPEMGLLHGQPLTDVIPLAFMWDTLLANAGWVIALLLLLLLLFRDSLRTWAIRPTRAVGDHLYYLLAGKLWMQPITLMRYRRALKEMYRHVHIPFRPLRPLDLQDVYVPLQVAGSLDQTPMDAYRAMSTWPRLVITGDPGSGKSMLLKHMVLTYAQGQPGLPLPNVIPILLELHRLNDPERSLQKQLAMELARNDFPRADQFIEHALERGTLLLLFDGLDEVSSNQRPWVVQQMSDLLYRYDGCRAVITCRSAVYHQEFANLVNQTLAIAALDDQQMDQFLQPWERDMHTVDKSVDHLLQTLRDRPQVLSLARNPLLLTIIAYLYTDTTFVLSRSRAEFYRKSTDILLDQWHQERNQFDARYKRLILQRLALFCQDTNQQSRSGLPGMDYTQALQQVAQCLPALNIPVDQQNAVALLHEIVERSGLLMPIDGGLRYQFAHLTFQEFFAAAELLDDSAGLLQRFFADPDTWRETVTLWCGLARDSTPLIRAIYQHDPITAFACLVDAQQVEPGLTGEIVKACGLQLGHTASGNGIAHAFGAFAADPHPRGAAVFAFLEKTLTTSRNHERRLEAAIALSLTSLPQAAAVLAAYYTVRPEVRAPLLRMGDRWPCRTCHR